MTMKDQSFGIELETTGRPRESVARTLAAHFGTTAVHVGRHLDNWEIPMPDGRKWTVESDASVTDPNAEIVSPVCYYEDIEMVQGVVRALKSAGSKADSSCGIHVHVGLGEHTPQSLRRLVNIVNAKDALLEKALGNSYRRNWCQPVNQNFLTLLNQQKPKTMVEFAKLWYTSQGEDDWLRAARSHYNSTRYHLLNLHATFSTERPAHTIEFRAFNGTLHAGKVKAYIQLCLAISYSALASKSASPTPHETDNPKYAFRCWLLKLGFIGDEYKTARLLLTKNLDGDSAFRNPYDRP